MWDPATYQYIDKGPCMCADCVAKREEELRKQEAMRMLPEIKAAKEKVLEFEERNGPVEAGRAIFTEFDIGQRKTKLRSQKARGLASARNVMTYQGPYWLKVAEIEAVLPQQGTKGMLDQIEYPAFARPCPVRPRHGFVDSRVVKGPEEVLQLLCETLRADPQGEMMLMRPLTGKASAVANDSGVVWGAGNDGVTSGKGTQALIPVPKCEKTLTDQMKSLNWTYESDLQGSAYLEIVEHNGKSTLVQVRDGPADTPVGGNYIPRKDYVVTQVISAMNKWDEQPDLLEWEKTVLAAPEGAVIWLPKGSLTSHYAVHALARKLAVVTDNVPPVEGAILQPSEGQVAPLKKKDFMAMAKFVKRRIAGAKKSRAAFSVGVLHALSAWGNEPHLLWMRVAGACMMARLLVSACVGEARHFYRCGPGAYGKAVKSALPWKKILGKNLLPHHEPERGAVLEKVYRYSIPTLLGMANRSRKDFLGNWGNGATEYDDEGNRLRDSGQGLSSFGGKRWAASAKTAAELCEAILAFERHPTEKRWMRLLMCYNAGVAAAHNGGRLLDKWAEWDEINTCATTPQFGLVSPQAMYICTGVKPHVGDTLKQKEAGIFVKPSKVSKTDKAKMLKEIADLDLLLAKGQLKEVKPKKKTKSKGMPGPHLKDWDKVKMNKPIYVINPTPEIVFGSQVETGNYTQILNSGPVDLSQ